MITKTQAIAGFLVTAIAAAIAIPAIGGAEGTSERTITVREKVRSAQFVHHAKSTEGERLATGDSVLTRQALSDGAGASLGTLYTDCVNVGAAAPVFKATLSCTSTYVFKDGQLVSQGIVTFSNTKRLAFPVVGGSGAYRGAEGEVTPGRPVKGFDGVDIIRLAAS